MCNLSANLALFRLQRDSYNSCTQKLICALCDLLFQKSFSCKCRKTLFCPLLKKVRFAENFNIFYLFKFIITFNFLCALNWCFSSEKEVKIACFSSWSKAKHTCVHACAPVCMCACVCCVSCAHVFVRVSVCMYGATCLHACLWLCVYDVVSSMCECVCVYSVEYVYLG